jgi:DNA-binding IclR family transcriptional regulator
MIKVLKKTFDILEYIASCTGRPVLPQEIAQAVRINQATCIRIIRDLQELGYLEQKGKRQGYSLAILGWAVFNQNPLIERLHETGIPMVSKLAEECGQYVVLSIIDKGRRFRVCSRNCNPNFEPSNAGQLFCLDCDRTASGLILLAFSDKSQTNMFLEKCQDQPDPYELNQKLEEVRKSGYAFIKAGDHFQVIACPVHGSNGLLAALAVSTGVSELNKDNKTFFLEKCSEYARKLSGAFGGINEIG